MTTPLDVLAQQALDNGQIVCVTFTKKDGSERRLVCTRNPVYIPEAHLPKGNGVRVLTSEAVRVYDLENHGWRSFTPSSVISVSEIKKPL